MVGGVPEDEVAEDDAEGHQQYPGCDAVVAGRGLEALEVVGVAAEFLALAGRVAVGVAEEVDVGVGVGADQSEEGAAPAAVVVAAVTALATAASGVTDEQFDQVGGEAEEGIHEGPRNNAAPVVADESVEGGVLLVGRVPVPVGCVARHDEHD